jgi:hypothetical protein
MQFTSDLSGNTVVGLNRQVSYPASLAQITDAPTFRDTLAALIQHFGYPQGFTINEPTWVDQNPDHTPLDTVLGVTSGCILPTAVLGLPSQLYSGVRGCPGTLAVNQCVLPKPPAGALGTAH